MTVHFARKLSVTCGFRSLNCAWAVIIMTKIFAVFLKLTSPLVHALIVCTL